MDAELMRGIVRIVADDSRGTGFVVRRRADAIEILTAFHVVGDIDASRAAGAPVLRAGTATVRFHSGAEIDVSLADPTCDFHEDWILLRHAASPPDDTAALPLAALSRRSYQPAWTTFGYSDAAPDTGEPHSGEIELQEVNILHLYGKQAAAGKGGRVSGLSGSPCIVEGQVVGVILDALQQGNLRESVHGAIYALPIQKVAARTGLPCEDTSPLPFQGELEQALSGLEGTFLGDVANRLGIVLALSDQARRRAVARALLRADAKAAREVLVQCAPHLRGLDAMALAEMLLALEVREDTARLVERACTSASPRGVGTAAGAELTAKLLALRALHGEGYRNAVRRYVYVDSQSRTPEDWAARIRSGLCGMLGLTEDDPLFEDGAEGIDRELAESGTSVVAVPFDPQVLPELEKYGSVRPLVLVPSGATLERDGYESGPPYRSKTEKDVQVDYGRHKRVLRR